MNCANHPEVERAAFCQNCGKPLCRECMKTVGSAVYCEPCLEAKLAGANPAAAGPSVHYDGVTGSVRSTGPAGASSYNGLTGSVQYTASGVPLPPAPGPNPILAGLLGFIPGVGAMFNGQFVKAVAHIVIFGVLVSLADKAAFFGILITGWVFYQVFDAYQTAKARRDGEPLPDPFGLNTLGDRIGIHRFASTYAGVAQPSAPGFAGQPAPEASPASASAPAASSAAGSGAGPMPFTPVSPDPFAASGYAYNAYGAAAPYGSATGYAPGPGAYGAPAYDPYPMVPLPASGHPLPIGAIVLIALGVFFMLGSMDIFSTRWLGGGWPFLLIGLGAWILIRRLQHMGGLQGDGSAAHRWHVLRALCFPVWVILLTGVLQLLDSWHVLSWDVGWAFYLIVWGVLVLAMRTATAQMQQEAFAAAQAQAVSGQATTQAGPAAASDAQPAAEQPSDAPTFEGR